MPIVGCIIEFFSEEARTRRELEREFRKLDREIEEGAHGGTKELTMLFVAPNGPPVPVSLTPMQQYAFFWAIGLGVTCSYGWAMGMLQHT